MSQENVEIVRRAWDVFLEGLDQGNLVAVFDQGIFAPRSTLTPPREIVGSRTYVGREGLVEWFYTWTEDFLDLNISVEEIIDAGGDRIVAVARQSARGKESGAAVEVQFAIVYTLKGGQVIDSQHYLHPDQALEAVGLSEQDAHST
jgi:ketosteroid isomerase-like protein